MHLLIGEIVMGQKITIRINGKIYELTAETPEKEEIYRQAAVSVNQMLGTYMQKFPGKDLSELISLVALNESIGRLTLTRRLESVEKETEMLKKQTDTYLDNIENQPPAITR